MSEITSELLEVSVDTDATVEIDSKLPEAAVDVTKSITVEIQPENYVLTSGGIYTGNLTGATPTWLLNAIQQQLTTGDGNVMSVLDDMRLLLDDLQLGINQTISQIENTNTSMSALETSLASRIDENDAAILDVYATRVTATEAQAIAATVIEATFDGNVDAYIGNLASVYTASGSATATNISTLQASYNDQTARIDTVEEVNIQQASELIALDTALNDVVSTMIPELQSQIDGQIDTWFYTGEPTMVNAPANTWSDNTTKLNHVGDLYYDKATGYGYRFAYEDIVDDPDMGVIFSWIRINDVDVVKALADAAAAQATADGKAAVYYKSQAEIDAITTAWTAQQKLDNIGDMWVDSTTGVSKIWNTTAWVNVATVDANTALAKLSDLEEARDGAVNTYYVTTAPASGMSYGDYWVDTDSWDGSKYAVYRYADVNGQSTGTLSWYVNTGETAVAISKAYRADVLAGTAQATADGKIKTWYQASAPTGLTTADIGDIWVDTDAGNLTKTWSGTAWVDIINTQSNTAYEWSAEASKLITDPNGKIIGWRMTSVGNDTDDRNDFIIYADNFYVSNATTGVRPFSIEGTEVKFNGTVSFTNVTDAPTINKTFVQATAPTSGMLAGDVWLDSDGGYAVYTYSGSSWVAGGSKTYSQTEAPTSGMVSGDIWIDTNDGNKLYRYNGSTWINQTISSSTIIGAINGTTNTTTIDGGKITTGSLRANQMFANRLVNVSAYEADGSINEGAVTMDIDLGTGSIYIK